MKRPAWILLALLIIGNLTFAGEGATGKSYIHTDLCAHLLLGPITDQLTIGSGKTIGQSDEAVLVRPSCDTLLQVNRPKRVKEYVGNSLVAQNTGQLNGDTPFVAAKAISVYADNLPGIDPILPIDRKKSTGVTSGPVLGGPSTVNWKGVFLQSGLFLGIEHGFRLATEPGTREGLKGPFFENYARSLGNLHGWADGDEFYVNYIGHPIQGSIAGYIFAQNDKARFKYVEFGKDRDYWKSRLRAFGYSAFYSAQFEIGPLSEASIGSIQSRFPQQGFVDLVATPALGLGWMIAEDAVDKYVIKRLEARFQNPYVRLLLRGTLNPTRSFANALRFHVPWHRDTRPNLFRADPKGEAVQKYLEAGKPGRVELDPRWRKEADAAVSPFEFDLSFRPSYYLGGQGLGCLGGGGTGAFRVASRWQAVMDIGGCNLTGLPSGWSGDSLHYLGGVRWISSAGSRWITHVQILAGGNKLTHELMDSGKEQRLIEEWRAGGSIPEQAPAHSQYTVGSEANAFALQTGVGLSYRMNSAIQWRLASVDYRYSWLPPIDGRSYRNSLSLTTGITLRMGSW